jgi:hypothetical protein
MHPHAIRSVPIMVMSVLLSLFFGCASAPDASSPDVELLVQQFPASEFAVENRGAVSIAYGMTVRNRSAATITLRQLEMQAVGRSPYVLRDAKLPFEVVIEPGKEELVTFEMWAYPREQSRRSDEVWVRGTVSFESTAGNFRKAFSQSFRQPDSNG